MWPKRLVQFKCGLVEKSCVRLTVTRPKKLFRLDWREVLTIEKCKFTLAQLHDRYVDRKLPISRVRM